MDRAANVASLALASQTVECVSQKIRNRRRNILRDAQESSFEIVECLDEVGGHNCAFETQRR